MISFHVEDMSMLPMMISKRMMNEMYIGEFIVGLFIFIACRFIERIQELKIKLKCLRKVLKC